MESVRGKTQVYEVQYGIASLGFAARALMALSDGEVNGTDTVGSRWHGTYTETDEDVTIVLHCEIKPGCFNAVTFKAFPHMMEEPIRGTVARQPDGNLAPIQTQTPGGTLEVRFALLTAY
jgi:hypothetical protein